MIPEIDVDSMVAFLVGLLNTPSPTGDTERAVTYVREAFAESLGAGAVDMRVTPKGALVFSWPGETNGAPRAASAHVDTLGAMVRQIKENGRLSITQIGGWTWTSVEGEGVTVFASSGEAIRGTILPTAASVHAFTAKERYQTRDEASTEVRLDVRSSSKKETSDLGIRIGDIVAIDPRVELSESGFIRSRHLDDKAGVATIYGAVTALSKAGLRPSRPTVIHISSFEEVGHGGAAGFPPDLSELLVIDMAVVASKQQSDEYSVTICAKDAGGPYHLGFRRDLEAMAQSHGLRHHTDVYPYYQSDGTAFWRAGGDVRVALIGPGVDASHHYERTHRDALESTAQLIAAYLRS